MTDIVISYPSGRWRCVVRRVKVAVAIGEDAFGRIQQVAEACRQLGFEHESTLSGVGVLVGSAAADDVARLRTVPGVTAVEVERDLRHGRAPRPARA